MFTSLIVASSNCLVAFFVFVAATAAAFFVFNVLICFINTSFPVANSK